MDVTITFRMMSYIAYKLTHNSNTTPNSTLTPTKSPAWKADGWEGDAHKPTAKPTASPTFSPTLTVSTQLLLYLYC